MAVIVNLGCGRKPLPGDVERACTLVRGAAGWRQTKTPTRRPYIGNGHGAGTVWIGELVQEA